METHDRASLRRLTLFMFNIFLVLDKKGTFLSSMGMLLDVDWRYGGTFLLSNPPPVQLVSGANQLRIMIYNYLKDNTFHL